MSGPIQSAIGARATTTHASAQSPPSSALLPMDAETLMLVAQLDQRDTQEARAQGEVEKQSAERDAQFRAAKDAEARAKAAQDDGGFFHSFVKVFSTVATVAGCVAAAASIAASGGVTAPLAIALIGTALSASSPMIAKATGSETLGEVAMWGGAAMAVGGGGMEIAGVGAGETAAKTTAGEKLALWVARGARVVEGGARVGEGVATVKEKSADADAVDEHANALARRANAKRAQAEVDDVIERLEAIEASARRAIASVCASQDEENGTRAQIIARMGRSVA